MEMLASVKKYRLKFKNEARTSRGVMTDKLVYYILLRHEEITGIGECSVIPGLSIDDRNDYELMLHELTSRISEGMDWKNSGLLDFPSIAFGLETALADLKSGGNRIIYKSPFILGQQDIPINGLIWMGDRSYMEKQIREKLDAGFHCIKLKIGGLDFSQELEMLSNIRKLYTPEDIEIRLDANGAFPISEALERLKVLSDYDIHSIEQPIRAGNWQSMASLCEKSPVSIALDEELIGIQLFSEKEKMLSTIQPDYIILKPALIGGFKASEEWIRLAEKYSLGWWVTSALESNIGLNAIAQWTSTLSTSMPQGLGTGMLYANNFESPLVLHGASLHHDPYLNWDLKALWV